ncbi:MAG: PH domain-containing protein [Actinomycetota bacterium]|nr:PH domain-containing protein [Actinomycetota bacterium]
MVLGIVLMVLLGVGDWPGWLVTAVGGVIILLIVGGVVRWWTTYHVITNERLIYRAGFIAKRGKEIPLEVINDVAFNQTIIERLFRTGDLLIESAGTHGQSRYRDIPQPEDVQSLIYSVREDRKKEMEGGHSSSTAPLESVASQLERLARLHDSGKLTDEEFESQKRTLLGGS